MASHSQTVNPEKVLRYEEFLNNVLREDLRKICTEREKVALELSELCVLETTLEKMIEDPEICSTSGMTTKIDLGCNFYATAKIPKSDHIFINVGFGFYTELTFKEALNFAQKKIKMLETRLEQLSKSSAHVKARIRLVIEALREIQGFDEEEKDKRWVIDF